MNGHYKNLQALISTFFGKWKTNFRGQNKLIFFVKVSLKLSIIALELKIIYRKILNGARNKEIFVASK